MYVNKVTLQQAIRNCYGTAGHLIKIWFTLKHMGLTMDSESIAIDTSNSTQSLKRLFSYGAPDNGFFVPFAHTPRYLTMKHDAARSIIQTTIQRWATSGSVVTCDPTEYLDINVGNDSKLLVSMGRRYPFGLGVDESGFALEDGARVSIPIKSFSVWYGQKTNVQDTINPSVFLVEEMLKELHISTAEKELVFIDDELSIDLQESPLTDNEIYKICLPYIEGKENRIQTIQYEDFSHYTRRVKGMVTSLESPRWMRTSPEEEVRNLIESGAKALLLFGPPRTGKTRLIDNIIKRNSKDRCTVQIHDGWGYDQLVEGFKPNDDGKWGWYDGPLKQAIISKKKYIILEEINRTTISQALGEVFSLIEDVYRGEEYGITLRSGKKLWIPDEIIFIMTMNTIDKSTEDIDDALIGRVASVEFPARPENLIEILTSLGISPEICNKLAQLFAEILTVYPLGHGYFAGLTSNMDNKQIIMYYKARIRPVLMNYLGELKKQELAKIDNLIDELFSGQ